MNKIYKVIWNKVRNCYVVVSEITKARSKGGSTVRRVPRMEAVLTAMLLASVLSLGISAPVWAESSTGAKYYGVNYSAGETGNLNGEGASGTHSIAAGVNAKATGENAISIGFSANSSEITGDSALWLPTVITNRMIRKFEDDGTPSLDDEGNPVYWSADNWQKWNDTTNGITKQNALTAEMNYRWKKESGGTDGSIAIGDSTFSLKGDVVIGSRALALGNDAVAVGREAIGYDNSVALGALASAAPNSIAIGGSITETKDNITTTYTTKAAANYSIAIGSKAVALQSNAMALGIGASAAGGQSTAVGYNASASGSNSTAAGMNAKAAGSNSTAVGFNARANGGNAVSIGNGLANTGKSIAIGDTNTEAKGNQSISIGASTKSFKENSLAMGVGAKAYGKESTTVGFHAYSFGENSTVFGHDSTSHGEASAVFGYLSTAGAVTLIKGDKEQKSTDAWSRTQVVRADKGSGGTITYVRLGKQSVSPNQYELVTTVSGQIVALKRDTAEKTGNNDIPEYHEVIELRKADAKDGNTTIPGYWFVVDTVNKLDVKKINIDDKYHIRKKVSEGVYIDYGSQTEGGVAFGDFTNAVGNKTLAVGRSTVADGNNSAAVGMFANAYGTGGMAYGQNTSTGLVNKIVDNSGQYTTNLKKPHAGSETINSESVAGYRRLVNGNSAMLNKLNESVLIDFRNSKGETVSVSPIKLNARGEISAYWTGTAQTDDDYLNPDNWSSVTKVDSIQYKGKDVMLDTDSNRYYYNDGEEKHYINDTEDLTFTFTYNNDSETVTAQAGNFLLSQGGMAVGAYAHAEGDKAMAIGRVAGAFGNSSAAVGRYANAFGEGSVAFGNNAVTGAQVTDDGDGKKILKLSADGTGIPVTIKKGDITEFVKGGVAIGS
ncbi:MAG: hypothetical protein IIZ16_01435, partial [Selenomonas sp.]|nr:hypothetical protein [Selenomonas sp.]